MRPDQQVAERFRRTSVRNALRLAKLLLANKQIRVTQAADQLGVAPSTAHRLLTALVKRDYAQKNFDGRYSAGRVLQRPSTQHELYAKVKVVTRPFLEELADRINETVNIQVLEFDEVRFILSVEAQRSGRVGDRTGHSLPLFTSAAGKAILASPRAAGLLESLDPGTAGGVGREGFMQELDIVRSRGYAVNKDQTQIGVTAIAKSFVVPPNTVMALSAAIPTSRYGPDSDAYLMREMERICLLIEEALDKELDDEGF
ncbi:IclR family transcriptional regulator [Arthrobacter sulfonylureivorans]|uniref:Helix-turn-helix domain-containing protein n=1 Tax=Arthrobacter sulfonylureivorans TaxID=2486855 RepID=A0ABY3WED2_9MICC|nr:IclR family transcriptional regulator C-terminal domain-containing protein [Arthrobacter sulfonylureivorans]UNK47782.1 helix-turn-helix domain-containing protein [Arthrobacter sulfonylureivorans]